MAELGVGGNEMPECAEEVLAAHSNLWFELYPLTRRWQRSSTSEAQQWVRTIIEAGVRVLLGR